MDDILVEGVSIDLKRLSGIEFKKKYGKDKYHMRQVISSQPTARKHFGYAPTGNAKGRFDASTSSGGNPARKDAVSGVKKRLANKQPGAKLHKKGGIGGANFGKRNVKESYELLFNIALDEFGVHNLAELTESMQQEFIQLVDQRYEFLDEDGNSYGPFWEDYTERTVTCADCIGRPGGVRGYIQPLEIHRQKADQSDIAGHICPKCGGPLHPDESMQEAKEARHPDSKAADESSRDAFKAHFKHSNERHGGNDQGTAHGEREHYPDDHNTESESEDWDDIASGHDKAAAAHHKAHEATKHPRHLKSAHTHEKIAARIDDHSRDGRSDDTAHW